MRASFRVKLGGSEECLYGFHLKFTDSEGIGGSILQEVADKVRDTWLEEMADAKGVFSSAAVWEYVRVDQLDLSPGASYLKVLHSAFAPFAQSGEGSYAGTAAVSMPWASSTVVSYAAYSPGEFEVRKARWRGRYYLPPTGTGSIAGTTGEFQESTTNFLGDHLAAYHAALNGELNPTHDDDMRLVVLSRADDTTRVAEQIWVDSKVDHQRRRENRQPASFKRTVLLDA